MNLTMGSMSKLSKRLQREADVLKEAARIMKKMEKGERKKRKKVKAKK